MTERAMRLHSMKLSESGFEFQIDVNAIVIYSTNVVLFVEDTCVILSR